MNDYETMRNAHSQILGTLTWLESLDERTNLQSDIILLRDVLPASIDRLQARIEELEHDVAVRMLEEGTG